MDRRSFVVTLGASSMALLAQAKSTGIIPEALAEEVEQQMLDQLLSRNRPHLGKPEKSFLELEKEMPPLPDKPTLADIINLRLPSKIVMHNVQSAYNAIERGLDEEIILACLLHDLGMGINRPDHGYRSAALIKPYVSEKVHWAVRYHQALRFYPDPDVGYEYPKTYIHNFGADYKPEPYIQADYKYARNHKWYMNSRLVTMMDEYSFDPNVSVSLDPLMEIIGRHFKQPKEGLGWDNTESSYMWRTLIYPHRPL